MSAHLQPDFFPGVCSGCLRRMAACQLAVRFAFLERGKWARLDLCTRCLAGRLNALAARIASPKGKVQSLVSRSKAVNGLDAYGLARRAA